MKIVLLNTMRLWILLKTRTYSIKLLNLLIETIFSIRLDNFQLKRLVLATVRQQLVRSMQPVSSKLIYLDLVNLNLGQLNQPKIDASVSICAVKGTHLRPRFAPRSENTLMMSYNHIFSLARLKRVKNNKHQTLSIKADQETIRSLLHDAIRHYRAMSAV